MMMAQFFRGSMVRGLVLAVGIALAPNLAAAQAASGPPNSNDIIKALTPNGDSNSPLSVRGLRLLNAKPGGGMSQADAQAPAIALDVKFALNSAELTPDAKAVVKQLATAMNSEQLSTYRFRLEGHTDSTGTAALNMALSKRRAESVRDYLVSEFKVAPSRLEVAGVGDTQPLDPAHPDAAVNRRVQVVNIGTLGTAAAK